MAKRCASKAGGRERRRAPLDDDVVAEAVQLVVARAVLVAGGGGRDGGPAGGELLEQAAVEEQLGLAARAAEPGLEVGALREVAQVAEEEPAAGAEYAERAGDDGEERVDRRQVLRDGVQDDDVELAVGEGREVGGVALAHLDVRQTAALCFGGDGADGGGRDVEGHPARRGWSEAEEHETRTAAELEYASRSELRDARAGVVDPLAHVGGGERLARAAVGPAGDVEVRRDVPGSFAVGGVPDRAPGFAGARAFVRRDDPGDELGAAQDDRRVAHAGVRAEDELDLRRLDPVPADLELVVEAAAVEERAVGAEARAVAGAVPADAVAEDEALGGALLVALVAEGEALAGDPELAGHAEGNGLAGGVDNARARAADRRADGDGLPALEARGRGPNRRLGRAVEVPDLVAAFAQGVGEVLGERLAAAPRAEAGPAAPAGVDEHPPRGRRGLHHRDRLVVEQRGEPARVRGVLGGRDAHARPGDRGAEELEDRDVEGERRDREQRVAWAEPGGILDHRAEAGWRARGGGSRRPSGRRSSRRCRGRRRGRRGWAGGALRN